jgi:NAD(P)-dependent dehydrogenase (short-subunit alcohol dehydrogenase family)
MMLRLCATVIATTRFPADSSARFAKEKDFPDWSHRLHIYGLDLRHIPSVELFASFVEQKYERLDILINNAAQPDKEIKQLQQEIEENGMIWISLYKKSANIETGLYENIIRDIAHKTD